jgi:hypothetical protein
VKNLNLEELCFVQDITVKVTKQKLATFDSPLEIPTEALDWKGPSHPHRTHRSNAVGNV